MSDGARPDGIAELRSSSAHVFVADLEECVLDDSDRHHLADVLRLRDGETVSASDGRGSYRLCTWRGSRDGSLLVASDVTDGPAAARIDIGMAIVKGDRPDWAVQKLTEVGVSGIGLFVADRSVSRWDGERIGKAGERFARIAREAAMQSRRCTLPRVSVDASLAALVARMSSHDIVVRAEPGGRALDELVREGAELPTVVIGPEGGWSEAEQALVPLTCDLGPTVLRTETAALIAAIQMR